MDTKKIFKHIPWVILGIIGAFCLAVVALRRGEHVSALWIVVASVSVYLVAYRYYSLYIAQKVMKLDPTRATPAVINNDGLNYVPTNRYVLFGHHFAAIAGAGPLVGPVLAARQNAPMIPRITQGMCLNSFFVSIVKPGILLVVFWLTGAAAAFVHLCHLLL